MRAAGVAAAWLAAFVMAPAGEAAEVALRVGIHLHSTVSSGTQGPEEIVAAAQAAGLDALIFTDSALRRWEYGLGPWRLIKRVATEPSVLTYGSARYAQELSVAGARAGVLVIPGVEAAPFYYWRRSPFDKRGGQLKGWHQHLLVFGLPDFSAVQRLPMTANPYVGNQGAAPYQRFIDQVRETEGLVFWAHPETPYTGRHGGIEEFTEAYPHLLETTQGYHGFAVTYLGALELVAPGGRWDRLLADYAAGRRAEPVWVIGELDWHDAARPIDSVVTHVRASRRDAPALLEGLRRGRAWVTLRRGRQSPPVLREFWARGGPIESWDAHVGGVARPQQGVVSLHVEMTRTQDERPLRLQIVKNGVVVHEAEQSGTALVFDWTDAVTAPGSYRLIAEDDQGVIYTNPIFVELSSP